MSFWEVVGLIVCHIVIWHTGGVSSTIVSRSSKRYTKPLVVKGERHCFCDNCGVKINRFLSDFIILNFLILRGRTRCCGTKIPRIFPVSESILWSLGIVSLVLLNNIPWLFLVVYISCYAVMITVICLLYHRGRVNWGNLFQGVQYCAVLSVIPFLILLAIKYF